MYIISKILQLHHPPPPPLRFTLSTDATINRLSSIFPRILPNNASCSSRLALLGEVGELSVSSGKLVTQGQHIWIQLGAWTGNQTEVDNSERCLYKSTLPTFRFLLKVLSVAHSEHTLCTRQRSGQQVSKWSAEDIFCAHLLSYIDYKLLISWGHNSK